MKGVRYSSAQAPSEYKCGCCGATQVKLWRGYNEVPVKLLCATCAAKEANKNIAGIDSDGRRPTDMGRTDQIGFFVPAVPDEEDVGYWGYTSVPTAGVNWWRRLPTLK